MSDAKDPLAEAKQRLSGALLGRTGVHAVGLRRSANAVVVYHDNADEAAVRKAAEAALGDAAATIALVREEAPRTK